MVTQKIIDAANMPVTWRNAGAISGIIIILGGCLTGVVLAFSLKADRRELTDLGAQLRQERQVMKSELRQDLKDYTQAINDRLDKNNTLLVEILKQEK